MKSEELSRNTNADMKNVTVISSPVTERYVVPGAEGQVDLANGKIRVGGVWFAFDDRWKVEPETTDWTFEKMEDANSCLCRQGFAYWTGKHVDMGEGFEHVFVFEYDHKYDPTLVCRIADLRSAQYKAQPGDRLPRIVGFVQVSVKKRNQPPQ